MPLENDRAPSVALLAGVGVMGAFALLPRGGLVQAAVFLGWLAVGTALMVVRVRGDHRILARPWLLLAAGVCVYAVATWIWYLLPVAFDVTLPFPSLLDGLYFLSYGLFGAFLLWLTGSRSSDDQGAQRLAVVDAAVFTNALLAILWERVISPIATSGGVDGATVTALAYPACIALLFGLAVRLVLGGIAPRGADLLLIGWVGGELLGGTFYSYASMAGTISHGEPGFLTWLGSYTALAALAVHPALPGVSAPTARAPGGGNRSRLALLLGAGLLPIIVALTHEPDLFLLVLAATGFILVTIRLLLVSGDLDEQRRLAAELSRMSGELRHRALHDPLTGLANRDLLMEALEHALQRRMKVPDVRTALLLLDIDGFKNVNDTLGHLAGDAVLVETGRRLTSSVRAADTVARLGGDEFAVILEDVSAEDALRSARRIIDVLREPVRFEGRALPVRASVGLHLVEERSDTALAMRNADLAMYAAKALGGDRYELYQADVHHPFVIRHELEMQLRDAADGDQLRVHYQPIVDLASDTVVGAEALLRWRHPQRGQLLPREFIGVAESSSVIVGIGNWVLAEACRQYVAWRDTVGLPDGFHVAVNVSRRQLSDPLIVDNVVRVLDETGCDPGALVLEVTETAVTNTADLAGKLTKLREFGVTIAMDDFGTGYSSFEQLRRLPIDIVKIDRSFVATIAERREDLDLLAAIVNLANSLRQRTVAEGIETPAQLSRLRDLNVDLGQGFLLGTPQVAGKVLRAGHPS